MDVQGLIDMAGGTVELAARLGVARTTVLDWKRFGRIPGNRVGQIALAFGIPADDLLPLVQMPRQPSQVAAE
jgi:hypothetical protein